MGFSPGGYYTNGLRLFPSLFSPREHYDIRVEDLKSLRENAVLEEGHGFSRAVNDTAIPGFSR
jgi:hypothetical protein